jgi:hypothetical protein
MLHMHAIRNVHTCGCSSTYSNIDNSTVAIEIAQTDSLDSTITKIIMENIAKLYNMWCL